MEGSVLDWRFQIDNVGDAVGWDANSKAGGVSGDECAEPGIEYVCQCDYLKDLLRCERCQVGGSVQR